MVTIKFVAHWTALAATFLGSTTAAAGLIVVAATSGPGVDYTSLPAAVSAAIDGDIILIDSGNYDATAVVGKALTLVAQLALIAATAGPEPSFRPLRLLRYYGYVTASIALGTIDRLRDGPPAAWEKSEGTR